MLRSPVGRTTLALAVTLLAVAIVALASGCGGVESPAKMVNQVKDQASTVARQANLAAIETAISSYELDHDQQSPTDINQLVSYLGGKIPVDPMGGTYYIQVQNGTASAAVR